VCVLCTCETLTLDVGLSWLLFGAGVRRVRVEFTPAQDDTRPGGMHGVDTIEVVRYVFNAALVSCAVVWRTSAPILAPCSCWHDCVWNAGSFSLCFTALHCCVVCSHAWYCVVWWPWHSAGCNLTPADGHALACVLSDCAHVQDVDIYCAQQLACLVVLAHVVATGMRGCICVEFELQLCGKPVSWWCYNHQSLGVAAVPCAMP